MVNAVASAFVVFAANLHTATTPKHFSRLITTS
jgi:hypothetical protein